MRRARQSAIEALRSIGILVALFISLFPVYWTLTTALKLRRDAFAFPPQLFPANPTLDNFAKLLADPAFFHALVSSVQVTIGSTIVGVIVGGFAAYALTRFRFPGAELLQSAILVLRIVPIVVLMVPLYSVFVQIGQVDQLPGLVAVYTAINLPFVTWLLVSFMAQVPVELEEAARVDGASRFQVLRIIVVPLVAPGLVATLIFAGILAWNEFLVPVVLASTNVKPLAVYISAFAGARTVEWGELAAAASLAILPIVVFSLIVQRYLVSGLAMGALKE